MTNIKPLARSAHGLLLAFVLLLAVVLSILPGSAYLGRLGLDFILPLAALLKTSPPQDADKTIALVVIDEVTHASSLFSETPEVAWTPQMGKAITRVYGAGAAVIGFDLIYPKTLAGPGLMPGFDRPFLQALAQAGRAGKLVLAKARLSDQPLVPYRGQVLAVGGGKNIRSVKFTPDTDGIVRRYPASFATEGGDSEPSFANELAVRAGYAPLGGAFLINVFDAAPVPAYRLSDLVACSDEKLVSLVPLFKDRIVLFGTALDVEDRRMAAHRFVRGKSLKVLPLPCGSGAAPAVRAIDAVERQSVPGVTIHAAALQTIVGGNPLHPLSLLWSVFGAVAVTGLFTLGFLYRSPLEGFALLVFGVGALWVSAALLLGRAILLPYLTWSLAVLLAFVIAYTYRVFFEDREKRWIRHAFRHYLSPALVNKLAEDPGSLRLGGERRHVAVMFVDLAGFTRLGQELKDQPEVLVQTLNRCLSTIADIIETESGYVDKFIGDAVMGVWGAPVVLPNPEQAAARAAVKIQKAVMALLKGELGTAASSLKGLRIGLAAGEVIAGNLGSKKRFNYTVVGDDVNLAARLETANKVYGTAILASEKFAQGLSGEIALRAVDKIIVVGRTEPDQIVELVDFAENLDAARHERLAAFEAALDDYRARRFETAAAKFAKLKNIDPVAALYEERATDFAAAAPDETWDGTVTMTAK